MKPVRLAIYGAGGFAREVAWLAETCSDERLTYEVVCFIDDNPDLHGLRVNDILVVGLDDARARFADALLIGGLGSPRARQTTVEAGERAGFQVATLIHPRVERSSRITIGAGTVICAGNILTTNIELGRHVQINLDCTIGHDVIMASFTTLAPGVHVSGWVHFGERVYVGTGAAIINGTHDAPLTIGADAVIGAGAVVTQNVEPGTTVVGVPARPIRRD